MDTKAEVLSMILCRSVREESDGRYSLSETLPVHADTPVSLVDPRVMVFAELTELLGVYESQIIVTWLELEDELFVSDSSHIESNDPRNVVTLMWPIPVEVFSDTGEYRVQLFVNGELERVRRLYVKHPDTTHADDFAT